MEQEEHVREDCVSTRPRPKRISHPSGTGETENGAKEQSNERDGPGLSKQSIGMETRNGGNRSPGKAVGGESYILNDWTRRELRVLTEIRMTMWFDAVGGRTWSETTLLRKSLIVDHSKRGRW